MNETLPKELYQLHLLKSLSISNNMISYFPEGLLNLKRLKHLYISGNQIRVITKKIKQFELLESIDLAGNQLETLPPEIGEMCSLKKIRINNNRIISLPPLDAEKHWLQLESIDLDGADIKELPHWFYELKSLKFLSLSKLHMNRFPEEICRLPKLERLYIDSTEFNYWPERIILPSSMRFIVLDGAHLPTVREEKFIRIPNAIIELEPRYVRNQNSINRTDYTLQVSLGGSISEGLDQSKLFNSDTKIAYNYLKKEYLTDETQNSPSEYFRLKDFKIVLLGAGAVGKSSLVQRLHLTNPDDDNIPLESVESTPGVNIDYCLNLHNIWDEDLNCYEDFSGHFWDFGGQDKYKGINSLLLTDKAIYIIVLDSRAQSSPDIWLEMIKKFAPESRIIMVANKIDENPRLNFNFKHYCEKYPQLFNCLFKVSCKHPSLGINKLSDIVAALRKIVSEDMNIITPIGCSEYIKIQTDIERIYRIEGKALLEMEEYSKICDSYGVTDEIHKRHLLSKLSACGSCIAIDDEDFMILNPNWIAKYLYLFYNNFNRAL